MVLFLGYYKFVHLVLDLGARVRHNKAKFVQIVPELKPQKHKIK